MSKRNITFVKRGKLKDMQKLYDEEILEWHSLTPTERMTIQIKHVMTAYGLKENDTPQ